MTAQERKAAAYDRMEDATHVVVYEDLEDTDVPDIEVQSGPVLTKKQKQRLLKQADKVYTLGRKRDRLLCEIKKLDAGSRRWASRVRGERATR